MNAAVKLSDQQITTDMEPVLRSVLKKAEREHRELQQLFRLMGWGDLPDALKIEIKEDVSAMLDELRGHYSSCDPYVDQRRKRVTYWVISYRDGICSLQTAVEALRIRSL